MPHPRFRELPVDPSAPPRSSWGLWGRDDEVGTINLLTPERLERATRLVRRGALFPLCWDLGLPAPALFGRTISCRHVLDQPPEGTDDWFEPFWPQGSTHWDALCHVEHLEHGFYNGRSRELVLGEQRNGIDHWARRGIAGRFVLLDLAAVRTFDPGARVELTVDDLDAALGRQRVDLAGGDVLLVRTGWVGWYERQPQAVRDVLSEGGGGAFESAGLEPSETVAEWLWDHEVSAIAADNPSVEATPLDTTSEQTWLHYRLLPLLGMPLGELFALDALAADCARTGCYEGLFTSAPLNARGGSGSPANALAIV